MHLRGVVLVILLLFLALTFGAVTSAYAVEQQNLPAHMALQKDIAKSDPSIEEGSNTSDLLQEHAQVEEYGHGHEDSHADAGLPQLNPQWYLSQIFWLTITFLILYTFFSKKVLPSIAAIHKKRRANIEHDLATAQQLRTSAEEAKARFERVVAEAQQKSTAIFLKAEEEAKLKINAGIEEFRHRAVMQVKQTEDEIETAKKKAIEGIHTAVAEIAAIAAHKIVGISTDINEAKSVINSINKKAA